MKDYELKVGDKVYVWRNGHFVASGNDPIIGDIVEIDRARGEVYVNSAVVPNGPTYVALLDETYRVGTGPTMFGKEHNCSYYEDCDGECDEDCDGECCMKEGVDYGSWAPEDEGPFPGMSGYDKWYPKEQPVKEASIFNLEQSIQTCWQITDDLDLFAEAVVDSNTYKTDGELDHDKIHDMITSIKQVYEMRFEKCWKEFEAVCSEYHRRGERCAKY